MKKFVIASILMFASAMAVFPAFADNGQGEKKAKKECKSTGSCCDNAGSLRRKALASRHASSNSSQPTAQASPK